ncbi:MAG: diacylglycerol kinase family lipid kinase, partial [Planctomycetes bacterium]|nr:diacylglycerol kinase family lipid kinase [Planctomycetota bacterium]
MKTVPIILNPISGRGIGLKVLPTIEEGLRKHGFEPEVMKTQKAGEAREFAAAAPDDCPYVVTLGGDGTLNEVINGIVPRDIPIAVFPTGTGNVFCKEIGLRSDVQFFLSLFETGKVKRFDVGFAGSRSFISVSGAGFNAEVVRRMEKIRRGTMRMFHYVTPVVHAIFKYPFHSICVKVDGEIVCEDAFLVEVGNTASYGGPLHFTSLAKPDDGILDVCAFKNTQRPKILKHMIGCITNLHLHCSEVVYAKGKTVQLTSNNEVPTHVDGDGTG